MSDEGMTAKEAVYDYVYEQSFCNAMQDWRGFSQEVKEEAIRQSIKWQEYQFRKYMWLRAEEDLRYQRYVDERGHGAGALLYSFLFFSLSLRGLGTTRWKVRGVPSSERQRCSFAAPLL